MFSGLHFAWIAICVAIIGGLLTASLLMKWKFKTASYVAVGLAVASELVKIFTRIIEVTIIGGGVGGFVQVSALPLHLCSLLIFVIFAMSFSKKEKTVEILKSFFVPVALMGGICSVLIPVDGVSFSNVKVWQGFIYHSGIIWFSLYLIITKQVDLKFKAYVRNVIISLSLIVIMLWVNGALQIYSREGYDDINFFFLVHPPLDDLPILNLNHGYMCYLFTLIGGGLALLTLVHIFPIIKQISDYKKSKKNNASNGNDK